MTRKLNPMRLTILIGFILAIALIGYGGQTVANFIFWTIIWCVIIALFIYGGYELYNYLFPEVKK